MPTVDPFPPRPPGVTRLPIAEPGEGRGSTAAPPHIFFQKYLANFGEFPASFILWKSLTYSINSRPNLPPRVYAPRV